MLKIRGTEIHQRISELTLEVLGSHASLRVSRATAHASGPTQLPCRAPSASPTRTSTCASCRSSAARTKSSATSWRKRSSASDAPQPHGHRLKHHGLQFHGRTAMLRDSVARYFGDHYAFPQRQAVIRSRGGLAARVLARPGRGRRHPGCAVRRSHGRSWRRRHRDHDRHGRDRQGTGHRTLPRHRGDRRRPAATLRYRARQRTDRRHHCRRGPSRLRASRAVAAASIWRTSTTSRSRGRQHWRISGSRTPCAVLRSRRIVLVNARASGAGAIVPASRCSSSPRRARAVVARVPDGRRLARRGHQFRGRGPPNCSARQGRASRCSKRRWTKAWPRSAPKPSASCAGCWPTPSSTRSNAGSSTRRSPRIQALQHRMVDMYIALEQAISMTYMATLKLTVRRSERNRAVSAAKVQVGKALRFVGQARHPVARRHGHDQRTRHQPLLQAGNDDRVRARIGRSSRRAHRAV